MPNHSLTRRSFAKAAAAAATAAVISPAQALAQSGPAKPDAPLTQRALDALAKLPPASRAEVEMKVSEIFRKYGDRLSAEQKSDIWRIMAETQPGLDKMRAFALNNSDQPATVFHASHAEKAGIR